jgi:hypothetical protein
MIGKRLNSEVIATFRISYKIMDVFCNYCKKIKGWLGRGHTENYCLTKKRESQLKGETQHQAQIALDKEDTIPNWTFMANLHPRKSNPNYWQYETACSTYLTLHLNILKNVAPDHIKALDISGRFQWSEHRGSVTIR